MLLLSMCLMSKKSPKTSLFKCFLDLLQSRKKGNSGCRSCISVSAFWSSAPCNSSKAVKRPKKRVKRLKPQLKSSETRTIAETGPGGSDPSPVSISLIFSPISETRWWKMRKEGLVLDAGEEVCVSEAVLRAGVGGIGCHGRVLLLGWWAPW